MRRQGPGLARAALCLFSKLKKKSYYMNFPLIFGMCSSILLFINNMVREVSEVAISYNKLWKLLIDKGIKRTELKTLAGVSTNVIAKLGKNDPVSMETLAKICTALKCDIADIVEMTGDIVNGGK